VARGPDKGSCLCEEALLPCVWRSGFGQTEIDDSRQRLAVKFHHENVRWFQVTVDDCFLVCVLHRLTHPHEELQPLANSQFLFIAVIGDGQARYVLHHQVGLAGRCRAGFKNFGNRWVVHHRQRLPLRLEALQQRFAVHAGPDQFQRDLSPDWFGLLGKPHLPHPAFANSLDQSVRTDRLWAPWVPKKPIRPRELREVTRPLVCRYQGCNFEVKLVVLAAGFLEKREALAGIVFQGRREQFLNLFPTLLSFHRPPPFPSLGPTKLWPCSTHALQSPVKYPAAQRSPPR